MCDMNQHNEFICVVNSPEVYKCDFCGYKTVLKVLLKEHLRVHHEEKAANSTLRRILKRYPCESCDFQSRSVLALLKHINNYCKRDGSNLYKHRPSKSVRTDHNYCKSDGKKLYKRRQSKSVTILQCKDCSYQSTVLSNMKQHIVYRHTDEEHINWYKCQWCAHKFKLKNDLRKHMLRKKHAIDANLELFKCEYCLFKVNQKESLIQHVLWEHSNMKDMYKFKCEQCPFRAKVAYGLKSHVLAKHSGPVAQDCYKCEQCLYVAARETNLKIHIRKVHSRN